MIIHQVTPVLAPFDAVSNEVIEMRDALRSAGHQSEIFTEGSHPDRAGERLPLTQLRRYRPHAIILHVSIGARATDAAVAAGVPLVIRYHNITPAHWFHGVNEAAATGCEWGRTQLEELAPLCIAALADSAYNGQELIRLAYPTPVVFPLLVRYPTYGQAVPAKPPVVAVVGRIVPNKRVDLAIRSFAWVRHYVDASALLCIIGSDDAFESYGAACWRLADRLRLTGAVEFTGRIDERDKVERLGRCSVLLTCSEHEGFCVPLVEAMSMGLPVVARPFAAVPETLGRGGLLVDDDDPAVIGEAVGRLIADDNLRRYVHRGAEERLAELDIARTRSVFLEAIANSL